MATSADAGGPGWSGRYPKWVHILLARGYAVLIFVVLSLIGNLLLVPLASGFDHWADGVKSQVQALLTGARTHPLVAGLIALVVVLLAIGGRYADKALTGHYVRETQYQRKQETRAIVREELIKIVPPLPIPTNLVAPTGLPRAVTLVGRDVEVAKLVASLRADRSGAAYAIEGMGGVGKSALAAEVVAQLAEDRAAFPGGAVWISCAGLPEDNRLGELWLRVARALEIDLTPVLAESQDSRAALIQALVARPRTLLALDNVEPELDANAVLDSLAVKEHTALLLTARHVIAPARVHALNLHTLTDAGGAALFIQRLKQLDPARPTAQEQAFVAEIVEAVGGLPLAIEQVASYAGVQRIALDRQLDQLRAHGVNAVAFRADPQRLLTAVFDRSWEALAAVPHRQRLFAALSLLASPSFPRAAALALAASTRFAERTGDTNSTNDGASGSADSELDVGTLVSYALIEPLAEERLRLHPLLRDYAALRLAQYPREVRESLGDAMVAYWLTYAEPLASQRHGGIGALEAEASGLLGALEWAHSQGRTAPVAALADALRLFWQERWHTRESLHFLPWGLEAAEIRAKETGARADALRVVHLRLAYGQALAASGVAGERKRGGEAEQLLRRSLDDARAIDDRETVSAAHLELGALALQHGDAQQAEAEYRQVLQIAEAHDDLHAKSLSVRGLGDIAFSHRELEQAEHYYRQVLADVERVADRQDRDALQRSLLFSLGQVAQLRGAMTQAEAYYRQALKRAEIANSPQDIATLMYCIGWVALQRGQFGEAESLLEQVYDRLHQAQDAQGSSVCLSRLGEIALKRQQWTFAQAYFQQALQLAETVDDAQGQSAILYQLGKLHLHQDLLEPAEQYFSAALKLNATTHDRMAEGMDLTGLGQIALKRHQLDEAEGLFQRSLVLLEQASDRLGEAITRRWLAETVEAGGRLELAAELYQTSLELARAVESALDVADGQAALGRFLLLQQHERERGCLLLREAEQGYTAMKLTAQANTVRALAQRLGCDSSADIGNETTGDREAFQGRQNATLS